MRIKAAFIEAREIRTFVVLRCGSFCSFARPHCVATDQVLRTSNQPNSQYPRLPPVLTPKLRSIPTNSRALNRRSFPFALCGRGLLRVRAGLQAPFIFGETSGNGRKLSPSATIASPASSPLLQSSDDPPVSVSSSPGLGSVFLGGEEPLVAGVAGDAGPNHSAMEGPPTAKKSKILVSRGA